METDASVMKSLTVLPESRAHCTAVPADGDTEAAGFGTTLPVPFIVLPSMWQRWQP